MKIKTGWLERLAQRGISKAVSETKIGKASLGQLSKAYIRMMGVPGGSTCVPSRLLGEKGLIAGDIRDMAKKGATRATIKDYFWTCPEFLDLWKLMGMTEANLDFLIEQNCLAKELPNMAGAERH